MGCIRRLCLCQKRFSTMGNHGRSLCLDGRMRVMRPIMMRFLKAGRSVFRRSAEIQRPLPSGWRGIRWSLNSEKGIC